MSYSGLCLDGPWGRRHVTHTSDVTDVPIRPPVPPSYADETVVQMSMLRTEYFRYHAVQITAGALTLRFWIPHEWYVEGQAAYTARIVMFLSDQYAAAT